MDSGPEGSVSIPVHKASQKIILISGNLAPPRTYQEAIHPLRRNEWHPLISLST